MSLSLDTRVRATADQVSTELDGELVLLHVPDGVYYGLDRVGTFLWHRMAAPVTVRALRDALVSAYEVSAEQAEHDLGVLLSELTACGLVVVEETA